MEAKKYYNKTRLVATSNWTLDMVLSFADEYHKAKSESDLEVLRNKLTPFKNLIEMLDKYVIFQTEVEELILREIEQCKSNIEFLAKRKTCDVCGSEDITEAPHMGLNCNDCNPIK